MSIGISDFFDPFFGAIPNSVSRWNNPPLSWNTIIDIFILSLHIPILRSPHLSVLFLLSKVHNSRRILLLWHLWHTSLTNWMHNHVWKECTGVNYIKREKVMMYRYSECFWIWNNYIWKASIFSEFSSKPFPSQSNESERYNRKFEPN